MFLNPLLSIPLTVVMIDTWKYLLSSNYIHDFGPGTGTTKIKETSVSLLCVWVEGGVKPPLLVSSMVMAQAPCACMLVLSLFQNCTFTGSSRNLLL